MKNMEVSGFLFTNNSRPLLVCKHGLHTPARSEYIKGLWEAVVVNQPGVYGEKPHHQDDVTPVEESRPYLSPAETHLWAQTN